MFLFQSSGSVFKTKPSQKNEPNVAEQLESLKQEFYDLQITRLTKSAKTYQQSQDKFYSNVKSLSSKLEGMKKSDFYNAIGFCYASLLWLSEKGNKSAAEDILALPFITNKNEDPTGVEKQNQGVIRAFNYINATAISFENRPLVKKSVDDLAMAMDRASLGTDSGQWQFGVSSEKSANEFKRMLEKISQVTGLQVAELEIVDQSKKPQFEKYPGIPDNWYVSFKLKNDRSAPNYLQFSPAQEKQQQQPMGQLTKEQKKAEKSKKKVELSKGSSVASPPQSFSKVQEKVPHVHTQSINDALSSEKDSEFSMNEADTKFSTTTGVFYATRYMAANPGSEKAVWRSIDQNIRDLANKFGYEVKEPIVTWLKSSEGQKFKADYLAAQKLSGESSTIAASSTVDVIYSEKAKNFDNLFVSVWNNWKLSIDRANIARKYLAALDTDNSFRISETAPKLYFFQNLAPETIDKLISTIEGVKTDSDMARLQKKMGVGGTVGISLAGLSASEKASLVSYLKEMKKSQTGDKHMTDMLQFLRSASEDEDFMQRKNISPSESKKAGELLAKMINDGAIDGATYKIKDISKFSAYFRRQSQDPNGMRVEAEANKSGKQNIFVRAMEESGDGFSRSVSIQNGVRAHVGIAIDEIAPGRASVQAIYGVGNKEIPFDHDKGNMKILFYPDIGRDGKREYGEPVAIDFTKESEVWGGSGGKYEIKLPEQSGKLLIYTETKEGEINSGLAWKYVNVPLPPEPRVEEKILSPETYEVVRAENIFDLQYAVPRSFAVSSLFPASEYLMNSVLKPSYKKAFNADYNSAVGEFNLPTIIDPSSIGVYRQEALPRLHAWLDEIDPNDEQGRKVRDVLAEKISTTPEKFVEAIANNQINDMLSYVKNESLRKQLGETFAKAKNYSLLLQQQHIADLMLNSFSGGVGVKFNLSPFSGTKETAAYVYVQHDATFLVTNVRLPRSMVSGKLAMTIDLGGMEFTPEIGAGVRLPGGGQRTMLQTKIGASLQIPGTVQGPVPAEQFISTIITASLTTTYHPDHDPFHAVRVGTGMKFRLAQQLSAKVHFERLLSPIKPLDFVNTTIAYKPYESLEIGATAGLGLQKNLDDKLPYQVGLNITYTPSSPKKQK
ncbi:MAG: hypothetical protein QW568_03055 [Candidatus Anstonellaceae archaeon]